MSVISTKSRTAGGGTAVAGTGIMTSTAAKNPAGIVRARRLCRTAVRIAYQRLRSCSERVRPRPVALTGS